MEFDGPALDGNPAASASLHNPTGVVADGAGDLTIAVRDHDCIRKVAAATGIITTLAGNGTAGYSGDGLASTDPGVSLNAPSGVVLDGAGNLYIADTGNNVIREILAANGTILTIAGTGQPGSSGDSGPATAALMNQPDGIALDGTETASRADTANHHIRRVNAVTSVVPTVAGNRFTNPVTQAGELQRRRRSFFFCAWFRRIAVSIATCNHWHALATIWACQAGKDVYVEKPASHEIWEGRKMVEAARKYNRMVQVGLQSRTTQHNQGWVLSSTRSAYVYFLLNKKMY